MISRHIGRILPVLKRIRHPASGIRKRIFKGIHNGNGTRRRIYISYKMVLQLGFISQSDPGFIVQTCAFLGSKFLVLKKKIEFEIHNLFESLPYAFSFTRKKISLCKIFRGNSFDIAIKRDIIKNSGETFVTGNARSFLNFPFFEPLYKERFPIKGSTHGNKICVIFLDKLFDV